MKKSLFVTVLALFSLNGCKVASIQPQELKLPNITLKMGDTIQFGPASGHFYYASLLEDPNLNIGGSPLGPIFISSEKAKELMEEIYVIKDLFVTKEHVVTFWDDRHVIIIAFGKKGFLGNGVTYYADIKGALKKWGNYYPK